MEFVIRALSTENFRALCAEYGISTKTGYKWRERFVQQGVAGMAEQSRRPRRHAQELTEDEICEILRLKCAHEHWGPRKLREVYRRHAGQAPSESSFKRVLGKLGWVRPRRHRRQVSPGGRLWTGQRAQSPNEVWTVDFKGWWYDAQRRRCEPLTVRDEYSRYVLEVRRLSDACASTVRACFERLFERYGLPGAIRSDNGSPFAHVNGVLGLSRLSAWWVALGIELERGRPGHPQDNGAHERLHRDIAQELAGGMAQQAELDVWREEFNHERPHEALGLKCPGEVYHKSARRYVGTPEDLEYSGMEPRKVSRDGNLRLQCGRYFIGASVAGWSVGLKALSAQQWEVWFGNLLLGWLDTRSESFQRAVEGPLEAGQR